MRINVWIVLIVLIALFAATRLLRYHQDTQRICADESGKKLWRPSLQRIEPSEKKSLKQIRSLKNRRQLGVISGQFSSIPAIHRRYPDNEQKNRDAQLRRKMARSPSRAGGKNHEAGRLQCTR